MTGPHDDRRTTDGTRYLRYVWLVYLGALAFQPVFDPDADALDWLAVAVLVAAFLPIYLATFRARDDRQRLWLIAALALLAFLGSLVNSGAAIFVVYAAATAGHLRPIRRAAGVILGLEGVIGLMLLVSPVPMPWRAVALAPALLFTFIIGTATVLEVERDRAQRRLLRAQEEIEHLATIAERERIARDLHDLLGHTLSVVVVKAQLAQRLIPTDPARAAAEVADIETTGRRALAEVRSAVAGYRARGLGAELDGAARALAAAGIEVATAAEVPPLRAEQETVLALAVRECVTNVVRHSGARQAAIRIAGSADAVILEVEDDGHGSGTPDGEGLSGMRERVAALGGSVTRSPAHPGRAAGERPGTRVRVSLPLAATRAAARDEAVAGR